MTTANISVEYRRRGMKVDRGTRCPFQRSMLMVDRDKVQKLIDEASSRTTTVAGLIAEDLMTRQPNGCMLTGVAAVCTFGWGDGEQEPPPACPMRVAPVVVVLQALDDNGVKVGQEPCAHGCAQTERGGVPYQMRRDG